MPISQLHQRLSDFKTLVADNVPQIRAAGADSWQGVDLSQIEVQIIYDYLSGRSGAGLAHLNRQIPPLFAPFGFEVKFAGVFCHGQPQVIPYRRKSSDLRRSPHASACELGDLHLVFVLLDAGKSLCDQRAILFQAKKAPPNRGAGSLIANSNQSCLYEQAGSFDYTTMLTGESRDWPKFHDRERALHYLFCGKMPVLSSSACAPAPFDFGELLLRFLGDSEGLGFRLALAWYRSWWHINVDLLTAVAQAYYAGTTRSSGDLTDVLNHFNDFGDPNEFFVELREGSAMPTLFVIVKDRKLKQGF